MNLLHSFKTIEAYDSYLMLVKQIENEKVLRSSNIEGREKTIEAIAVFDGDYKGMSALTNALKVANACIKLNNDTLKKQTKKYYELLKYFTV